LVRDDDGDVDFTAAVALARRRRLGPFSTRADRHERREKDMAALARAGFGYDIALKVIDAETPDELERMKHDPKGGGLGYYPDEF
jgi:regulatory protein